MNALILAAGYGTRLKPWTDAHPKALAPVEGVPMLQRVYDTLADAGFTRIFINTHHFAEQIESYRFTERAGVTRHLLHEPMLKDTGGTLSDFADLLFADGEPLLVHNVDILSNADLGALMQAHRESGADATLLCSLRQSSRKLFAEDDRLCGWHNVKTGEYRPSGFAPRADMTEVAFSGIHVISPAVPEKMKEKGFETPFPIMDFYLSTCSEMHYNIYVKSGLRLLDIGTPEKLAQAAEFLR